MSYINCCEVCDSTDATWRIHREDGVVSWACMEHLGDVCLSFQRDWEVTALKITLRGKQAEWAVIGKSLNAIAESS